MSENCESCGESIWTYARHPKWQRVGPGTVIPAGQPYRHETPNGMVSKATEFDGLSGDWTAPPMGAASLFVDSSWRPPLDLPTEPTWGVAIFGRDDTYLSLPRRFAVRGDHLCGVGFNGGTQNLKIETVRAFFALTDEQVAQIEAAR